MTPPPHTHQEKWREGEKERVGSVRMETAWEKPNRENTGAHLGHAGEWPTLGFPQTKVPTVLTWQLLLFSHGIKTLLWSPL